MLFSILNIVVLRQIEYPNVKSVMVSLLFLTVDVLYFYISLRVLNHFNNIIKIQVVAYGSDETYGTYIVAANKWQRALNKILDGYIGLLAFTPFIQGLIHLKKSNAFIMSLQEACGERVAFYLFVVCYSIIYYLIVEGFLGASPAKYITGTRVAADDDQSPSFGRIFRRTLLRIVPLEFVTFLVSTGWHDLYSGTVVAKEESTQEELV
ncbi:RDD family protein [Mucilaginibacter lutimaris]|uniref:RDD family protein n=1 Tax=Mucilaginibacter lutimaris TaxID=931629 RepID=A0ABW2ZJP3_9SPHI